MYFLLQWIPAELRKKNKFQFGEQGRGRGKPWSNCFSMLSVVCQGPHPSYKLLILCSQSQT